jgi:hypothetical protein
VREDDVTRQRSSYSEAIRTAPFSYVYWGVTVVEVALAVWSWVWAPEWRSATGWVIIVAVLVMGRIAQVRAARIERDRAAGRVEHPPTT